MFLLLVIFTVYRGASTQDTSCKTPSQQEGRCVRARDCESVMQILAAFPLKDGILDEVQLNEKQRSDLDFLRKSKCQESDHSSVCCPLQSKEDAANCGEFPEDRIIGGNVTQIDGYPWTVILYKNGIPMCGGTLLVGSRHMLTAASCIDEKSSAGSKWTVKLGEFGTTTEPDCVEWPFGLDCAEPTVNIGVKEIRKHPTSDIAVLILDNAVKNSDFILPVCLPSSGEMKSGDFLFVSGWNISAQSRPLQVKHQGHVERLFSDVCRGLNDERRKETICGKGRSGWGSNTVDHGGALTKRVENFRHELIGVASARRRNLDAEVPPLGDLVLYTEVYPHLGWIKDVLQKS